MSKLPSRCFFGSTLIHGALLGTLWVVSSGFLKSQHKPTDMGPVMTWVNPDNLKLVDRPGMVGGGEPQPAPPEAKPDEPVTGPPPLDPLPVQPKAVEPPPQAPPKGTVDEPPPQPEPAAKPAPEPPPEPKPKPKPAPKAKAPKTPKAQAKAAEKADKPELPTAKPDKTEKVDKTAKADDSSNDKAEETTPKPQTKPAPKRQIKVDLRVKTGTPDGVAEAAAEAKRRQDARERAEQAAYAQAQAQRQALIESRRQMIGSTVTGIQGGLSSSTAVSVPGAYGEAYMDYGLFVKSRYEAAWRPPSDLSDQNPTVKAEVIIARDGTIVSTRILQKSGIAALDKSVSEALGRVDTIGKSFPEGAKDEKRQFIINFNLKSRRANG